MLGSYILYLSGNTCWNISSNSNSTNLCFSYNGSNKCYHDTTSNLNTVNISNAPWRRYQAIKNGTAISIPASTSFLALNCTYTGNATITSDEAISDYYQLSFFIVILRLHDCALLHAVRGRRESSAASCS